MKSVLVVIRAGWVGLTMGGLLAALPVLAAPAPYIADPNTVFLFHFDEPAGGSGATNSAGLTTGTNLVSFDGNPYAGDGIDQTTLTTVLGATGFAGFGNSADVSGGTNRGLGLDASLNGAFGLDDGAPLSNDRLPTHIFFGSGNAFTLEALVNVSTITGFNQEIISTDQGSGNTDRGLQFRINAAGALEFNFVGVSTTSVTNLIPTSGPDAFVPGEWFHVALSYDGANASFYWTRLNSGATNATLLGTPLAEGVDIADDMLLVIGNEGRAVGAVGSTEGLRGLIDEVRISNVARGSNEFVFRSASVLTATGTQLPNVPENTLDGNLATRWSAQFDGQYITYDLGRSELVESIDLAFYQPTASIRSNYFAVFVSNDNFAWRPVLTNAIGTNANLANFDLADWPARYVRYVGHLNSVNDFNSLTEAVIHSSLLADADTDGLPDFWENFYFGNLNQTGAGDPDADSQSNFFEYQHNTDPTVFNTSGDSDGDGLADVWENANFGNLSQTASGDPDRDGFSNLVEYQNGCDPNNPNSVPGDTDGDGLPDAWEVANLGGLTYSAYEDPDNDGYNNLAEMIGGTDPLNPASHPDWKSPRVALMRDSIVTNNACLMPTSAPYGRAINGIAFQTEILLTFNGYQYTGWYDTIGTVQTMWLARRAVTNTSVGAWEKFNTGSAFSNGDETPVTASTWDAHNVISLGISPVDGTLHVSWDHHGNTLRYRRSVLGLCTTNKVAWGTGGMLNAEQNWLVASGQTVTGVTYPMFINTPSGGLIFEYRTGSTSAGDHWLHNYIPATTNWTAPWKFSAKEGTYTGVLLSGSTGTSSSRNAYENGFDFSPDGTLHHTWTYREAADAANHDIHYAYSTNGGVTWRNNTGAIIADTNTSTYLNVNSPGIIAKVLDSRQLLINQQAQTVDNDGRVHLLMLHRRVEPGFGWTSGDGAFNVVDTAYYHYFRDPATGVWSQRRISPDAYPVGCRPSLQFDAQGNVYAAYLSYATTNVNIVPGYAAGKLVIATASKASQYTDWEVVAALPTDLNGEPAIDRSRLLADNILSVFIQENSSTTTVVGTPLHVFDFAIGVKAPSPVSLNFLGSDALIAFTGQSGHTYQLQVATTLAPGDWTYVGSVLTGINGPLALPDPNGRSANRRFYRIIQDP